MQDRFSPWALLLIALAIPIAGCSNPLVDSLAITPTTASVSADQSFQFTAIGTIGHGNGHPSTTQDDTDQATWTSSNTAVATIGTNTGLATALTSGTTTITASMNGYTGLISATATLTVSGSGIGTVSGITSLSVIPGSQAVAIPGDTSQFLAIGTSSSGATTDLTDQVEWLSASSSIATIGTADTTPATTPGLAQAVSQGSDAIVAEYTNPGGGSTVTGTGTFTVNAGSSEQYTAVTIVPNTESLSAGGTANLIAMATQGSTGLQQDVTNLPNTTWLTSAPSYVTVTSGLTAGNGVVMGVGVGSSTITVEVQNPDNSIVSSTAVVTGTSTTPALPILSLNVIPSSITVGDFQLTGQFLAIATYATPPYVRDVTNDPCTLWISTLPEAFPVSNSSAAGSNSTGSNCGTASTGANLGASGGIVTAYASGQATIVAEVMSEDNNPNDPTNGTIQTAEATFSCPEVLPATGATTASCYPGEAPPQPLLSTLTVYNEGLNTTNWYVTAASTTGTPNVLHCGPGWALNGGAGGSVCTATYAEGTTTPSGTPGVLVEAQQYLTGAQTGTFGGWSTSCYPSDSQGNLQSQPYTYYLNQPNYCVAPLTVTGTFIDDDGNPYTATVPNTNVTVGVIFN